MEMSAVSYQVNDLVWAKMKGFSPWPGKVSDPPPELKKTPKKGGPVRCIFFFGSNNYAWIEEHNIKPYNKFKDKLKNSSKSVAFKDAVESIENYINNPEQFDSVFENNHRDTDAEFNKLRENDEQTTDAEDKASPGPVLASPPTTKKTANKRKSEANKESATKRKRLLNDSKTTTPDLSSSFTPPPRRNLSVTQLLNRPSSVVKPEAPEIDVAKVSTTLKSKNINPSSLSFGFLGLGIMGSGIVKNLINSGHKVCVWNRTASKCRKFEEVGADVKLTPCDVIDATDITFSCVSDPQAAKDMVFGNCGVLQSDDLSNKGYVEMTTIDAETSQDIAEAINNRMGRYLEAQIQGSKSQAEEGTLIILAAGERTLFDECQTCFEAMGRNSFYLGDVGHASKMNLVLQMMGGVALAGFAEAMALADRAGLQQKDVLEVLELTSKASPMMMEMGQAIIKGDFPTNLALSHMQKDLKLALSMSEPLEQPLPLAAASNQVYIHAKRLGYGDHDASAVYVRARF